MSSLTLLENCMMIANDNGRSRAYLDLLFKNNMVPSRVLVIKDMPIVEKPYATANSSLFDNKTPLESKLKELNINYAVIKASTLNCEEVENALEEYEEEYCIFSVCPGHILGEKFFELNKKYIHVHPGKLPQYRGSTPMYYSLLEERKLSATAMFLKKDIDTGLIIAEKEFAIPKSCSSIDLDYDHWMRADLLKDIFKKYLEKRKFPIKDQTEINAQTYYIIHPVLKHLAILSGENEALHI